MHNSEIAFHGQPACWEVNLDCRGDHSRPPLRADGATAPGLTIPHHFSDRKPTQEEAHIRKVLVATDFTPSSAKAIEHAAALANQCNATLTILHVIDINAQPKPGRTGTAVELMKDLWAESFLKMGQMVWSLSGRVNAQTAVQEGLPWEEIVNASREADLLVLGKSRAKSRASLFSRHTASRVLEKSACPVLVVRETD